MYNDSGTFRTGEIAARYRLRPPNYTTTRTECMQVSCINTHHVPTPRIHLSSHPPPSMSTSTKISPLRHLVNILSDAVTRIDEKYASANLEFPMVDKPFHEKDPACLLLSDPDVVPFASVIVAAADQLIASARPPVQAILDMAQSVRILVFPSLPAVGLGSRN